MRTEPAASLSPSAKLSALSLANSTPLICTFELTQRCNLRCRHCYLDKPAPAARRELSTRSVQRILKDLTSAGTLYLVFTGGEVFLRPDILTLCASARDLGFDLRLFTNATLLTRRQVKYLSHLSLSGIEISLYGNKATHDHITRSPLSFDKTIRSIELLRHFGIPVVIKTPLMTLNIHDLHWLKRYAHDTGAKLKVDPILVPGNNGDTGVLAYRLNRESLADVYSDPELFTKPVTLAGNDADLVCSAGKNMFAIAVDGTVFPCLQLLLPLGNLKKERFSSIWHDSNRILSRYRAIGNADITGCHSCNDAGICQRCPGLALLEEGSLTGRSGIACTVASVIRSLP